MFGIFTCLVRTAGVLAFFLLLESCMRMYLSGMREHLGSTGNRLVPSTDRGFLGFRIEDTGAEPGHRWTPFLVKRKKETKGGAQCSYLKGSFCMVKLIVKLMSFFFFTTCNHSTTQEARFWGPAGMRSSTVTPRSAPPQLMVDLATGSGCQDPKSRLVVQWLHSTTRRPDTRRI